MRGLYRILVGKPDGKRPLGRPRRIWEGNIIMELQAVGLEQGMDLSGSQGQVAGSCECGNEPPDSIKCAVSLDWLRTS
jgi:hypothetical protein